MLLFHYFQSVCSGDRFAIYETGFLRALCRTTFMHNERNMLSEIGVFSLLPRVLLRDTYHVCLCIHGECAKRNLFLLYHIKTSHDRKSTPMNALKVQEVILRLYI